MKLKRLLFQPWLLILVSGVLLFLLTLQALRITDNPNYYPTVILLGSFVVPVAFVTYFYDHVRHREISMPLLSTCFIMGGVLGSIAAGILEFSALTSLNFAGLFGVSIIEEGAKLIIPVAVYLGWRYRHEADGLLFGVAAGMGFAALETMGYALVNLVDSQGDIQALQQVLLARGLLSPAGHAAWTGFVCAVLWRERERKGHVTINLAVIGAFLVTVLLHASWNIAASFTGPRIVDTVIGSGGVVVLVVVSLTLLIRRYYEAKRALGDKAV